MPKLVPFEPGMEGHFVPYEAMEEWFKPVPQEASSTPPPQPATDDSSSLQKTEQ